jgi:hypothetical protein
MNQIYFRRHYGIGRSGREASWRNFVVPATNSVVKGGKSSHQAQAIACSLAGYIWSFHPDGADA